MNRTWRSLLWVPVVSLAVGVALLAWPVTSASKTGGSPHDVAESRLSAVREASAALVPGARLLAASGPTSVTGDRSSCGTSEDGGVTYAVLLRRRVDFSEVSIEPARGGPVEPLLALAIEQEKALARAGFEPMTAEWATRGNEGRTRIQDPDEHFPSPAPPPDQAPPPYAAAGSPRVHVTSIMQRDSGGSGGPTRIDLRDPVIVHHRMYVVPKSGATLFVRNVYDQIARIVDVEFAYADRTVFGVEYPTGSTIQGRRPGHYKVHEQITLDR